VKLAKSISETPFIVIHTLLRESNVFTYQCKNALRRSGMQAVIYVVDSSDVDRLGTSREEFHAILDEEELKNALILVYANKQDISGALTEAQVAEGLGLHDIKNRDWAIFKASAIKGTGLFEGLEWLSSMLKNRR
jgi:ADP-ribosylation factor-like protein 1